MSFEFLSLSYLYTAVLFECYKFLDMKRICLVVLFLLSALLLQAQHTKHYDERVALFNSEKPLCSKDIVFLGNSLTEGGKWDEFFPDVQKKLQKKGGRIANRGIIGDDAPGIYDRLYQILPAKPKKIFLLVGINDISHNVSADSVVRAIDKIVCKIRQESPDTKLYVQTLLPINESFKRYKNLNGKTAVVPEVNEGIRKMAKERGIKCIDLFPLFLLKESSLSVSDKKGASCRTTGELYVGVLDPSLTKDGLHLIPAGYDIWCHALKKYVK